MKKTVTLTSDEWKTILSVLHFAVKDSSDYDESARKLIDSVYAKMKDEINK